jgi:hypothetical protein
MNGHDEFSKSENNIEIMGESPPSKYMAHCAYTAATNAIEKGRRLNNDTRKGAPAILGLGSSGNSSR